MGGASFSGKTYVLIVSSILTPWSPVACFGAAQRKMYKQDLCKTDIVFRRLLRAIVGPPGDVDWTLPWHEILYHWSERMDFITARHCHGLKTFENVVCGVLRKMLEICYISFQLARKAMGCESIELVPPTQHFCRHN